VGRHRDDERDNRVVHLRHTPEGLDTGEQFFGPLGRATEALMAQFSLAEIVTVARFMDGAVAVLAEYVQAVGETPRPAVTPSSNSKTPPS
jgi:hypothetical protein